MRILRVTIGRFKNLTNLTIQFDEHSPYSVFVGENGSGKSNFIEALTLIFRNLDLDEPAPFEYSIEYECRGNVVRAEGAAGRWPKIQLCDSADVDLFNSRSFVALPRKRFHAVDRDGRPEFKPAFVFGYYSGPSDRLAELYERHSERFYAEIIRPSRHQSKAVDPNSLRRLFYAQTLHGQFALLAFFMDPSREAEEDREFLRERLQIDGLNSVLFALRRPTWKPSPTGDPRFWGAEGEVRDFLSRVFDEALHPMRMERRISTDFVRSPTLENLYLFLPSGEALERVYASYGNQYSFFTALESTHLSKLLGEVRTRVRMTPAGGGNEVTYRDLSEGEQQLLLVLGLLKFTARDEALFLLDEPDTHLNPAWSTEYLSFLDRFIRLRERTRSCHILMSTHDPLVFSRLTRSQVVILRRDEDGSAIAEVPEEDPRGMGVNAILTSDLFRLRTTLDKDTQLELDRQRVLSSKPERTEAEDRELKNLSIRLRSLGITQTMRDPLYQLFVRAWTKRQDLAWTESMELSREQLHARDRLADEILGELLLDTDGGS